MSNHFLPTDRERARIERITAWRSRLPLIPIIPLGVLVISRILPEESALLSMGMAILATVILLSIIGYVSFGLRCPRCSTWVGVTVPKCASCGLRFDAPRSASVPKTPV